MVKFGRFIAKHKYLILIISMLLLIPAVYGYANTRINYDVLSYLPKTLDTVAGQDIMVDEFGMGAFSMIVVDGMEMKDVAALKQELMTAEHVTDILWYDNALDITVPTEMLPDDLRTALFNGDATMMIALFEETTSSDSTMDAIEEMRDMVDEHCFISGMSGVVTDIKNLSIKEMPVYVAIAAVLSMLVLCLTMESLFVPILFLFSIGVGIIYNLGSNIFLGEISYITQALTAVLQLGVTMDYSIFLLSSYEENKKRFEGDNVRAMAHAISNTFKSVAGSSFTTVAGFAALMFMTFALGRDIGVVMIKGVVIGVICCITLLPALILVFDKVIAKTSHKPFIPSLAGVSHFITKHYMIFFIIFAVLLVPAFIGNKNVDLYYNIDSGLPDTLESSTANAKLKESFDMNSIYMVLLHDDLSAKEKNKMLEEIKEVDGVKWALGIDSFLGASIPSDLIPDNILSSIKSEDYEIQFICSDLPAATDECNEQIARISDIVKTHSPNSIVMGEAPLMKDLEDVTDIDLTTVNIVSMAAIFLIIAIVYKSISIPVILVAVIEFAIFVNMAIPYYSGISLPFVASIVIGTIQLGATVDYAILMTGRYQKERSRGKDKKEAIRIAHETSMEPILTSGLSFFAATVGVGIYSSIDMISSITVLLSRGAIISTIVVLTILPAMFMIFDPLIFKTSIGFLKDKSIK